MQCIYHVIADSCCWIQFSFVKFWPLYDILTPNHSFVPLPQLTVFGKCSGYYNSFICDVIGTCSKYWFLDIANNSIHFPLYLIVFWAALFQHYISRTMGSIFNKKYSSNWKPEFEYLQVQTLFTWSHHIYFLCHFDWNNNLLIML